MLAQKNMQKCHSNCQLKADKNNELLCFGQKMKFKHPNIMSWTCWFQKYEHIIGFQFPSQPREVIKWQLNSWTVARGCPYHGYGSQNISNAYIFGFSRSRALLNDCYFFTFSHFHWLNVLWSLGSGKPGLSVCGCVCLCVCVSVCVSVTSRLPKLLGRFQPNLPKWVH